MNKHVDSPQTAHKKGLALFTVFSAQFRHHYRVGKRISPKVRLSRVKSLLELINNDHLKSKNILFID